MLSNPSKTDQRILRVGIAGLGFGAAVHVPAFRDIPGVEVVAIAGQSAAKAERVAGQLGVANFASPASALLDHDLDIVSLALPPDQNEEVASRALCEGLAVLCEKPLCATLDGARRVAELAAQCITAIDFQFAELPAFKALRGIIESERFGKPIHLHIVWLVHSYSEKAAHDSWKTDASAGGGALNMFGSHLYYLIESLFGSIQRLRVTLRRNGKQLGADSQPDKADNLFHMEARTQQGVEITAIVGNANPGMHLHQWNIICGQGSVMLENRTSDYMSGFTLTRCPLDAERSIDEFPVSGGDGRIPAFKALATRFIDGIRHGHGVRPSFGDGLRVQELLAWSRLSNGQLVDTPLPPPQGGLCKIKTPNA